MAGMNGHYRLRFRDVVNQDIKFEAICGGSIRVDRSANGTTYFIDSNTDHWRVFCNILTPDDMPSLFFWDDCTNYGWWILEGYQQKDFTPGGYPINITDQSADEISKLDLGEAKQVDVY